ncbi:MAG: hypothetical protein GXO77_02845, partial [Calditrichaeota bacterium]|nr:hypothetical protein [Calditrichota bacterium]
KARVTKPFKNKGKRPNLVRIQLLKNNVEYPGIEPLKKQGSHMITSVSQADGYVILEPEKTLSEGDLVEVYLFPWRTNYGIY